jgi:uncharacterized membrane protein YqaE (UPF0057 family)
MDKDINVKIDLSEAGKWMEILVARVNRIVLADVPFIILAIILPPIAVLLKVGLTAQFWINLVLTVLGFVPGQIHALWVVLFL